MRIAPAAGLLFILTSALLFAQNPGSALAEDPAVLVGATLADVVARLGAPRSVHAVRGPESWQDDVVFVYADRDLYWFRDRVWQVGLDAAYGLARGDSRDQALALRGEPLERPAGSLVYILPGEAWPLRLRLDFDAQDRVRSLFVYRADF
jgi:hypothetical protein